jgi:vacuolar protein sorting-associated protein 26
MDGCPVNESQIPIRLYLKGVPDLGPTMNKINNRFSVKYFLDLKIIDEMNRKYFKQHEIVLYRNKFDIQKSE